MGESIKYHNEVPHSLCCIPDIFRGMKSRRCNVLSTHQARLLTVLCLPESKEPLETLERRDGVLCVEMGLEKCATGCKRPAAGCCEQGDKPAASIKGVKFLGELSYCQLLKKRFSP